MPDTLPAAFAGLTTARPEEIGLERAALQRLTAAMEREIAAGRAPGVSMLIARHGKVGFAEGLGALRPADRRCHEDAIFRIYSMTKPIVSVAAMTLVEEGRLLINDPVSKYIPAFAEMKVGVENGEALELVPAKRPITIQDLMRHTSGLTYGFTGGSKVQKLVSAADLRNQERTAAEHVEAIARLPLQHQPGEVWEYSVSTDVLGRIVEIIAGGSLGEVLRERIFAPLGMNDTAFFTPASKLARRAEPFSFELFDALGISRSDMTRPSALRIRRRRAVVDDRRLCALRRDAERRRGARRGANSGLAHDRIHGERPSRRRHVAKNHYLLWPGHGFGLGFCVRTQPGLAPTAGSVGEYFWGGAAGTAFWISPRDDLFAIIMVQTPEHREYFRVLFRNLVNAAVA